ncbi:unnamed protein product, partial [Polarella glacialis]
GSAAARFMAQEAAKLDADFDEYFGKEKPEDAKDAEAAKAPSSNHLLRPPAPLFQAPAPPQAEAKRRRLAMQLSDGGQRRGSSSPSLGPGSPIPQLWNDPEVVEYWSLEHLNKDSPIHFATMEIRRFLQDWDSASKDPFWHRKSGKPVLSVLVCRSEDGLLTTFRGMNTEVSLPAGSFCAERAAITRAATDFSRAGDIVAVAVVDPVGKSNPLWPCEVCQSWLSKLRVQSPEISVIAFESRACESFAIRVNGELLLPPLP